MLTMSTMYSCLNEDPLFDPDKSQNIVEFFDIGAIASPPGAVHPMYVNALSPGQTFSIILSYSGAHENPSDLSINLELSQEALDRYNEEQGSNYEILPAELYSMSSMSAVIPAGESKVEITIAPDIENFDFAKSYALPLVISSASHGVISKNFGTAIFSIGGKNRYDGVYEVTGTMVDATTPGFTGVYPKVVELRTVDVNTVNYYDVDYALAGHIFNTGTGASYYGSFIAQFSFDDADNVESVINAAGQPAANGRSGRLADGVNKFTFEADGVTPKTMEVTYIMVQAGADRTTWTETYTYIGPR